MEQYQPNDLLIFAKVAESGSFSAAAQRLGMPKSSISRRVAILENQLGERLLLRTTRRLALTEFGQQLLQHARLIADEVDAVKALGEFRRARPSGRLRVSVPHDFAVTVLAEMLPAFVADHPAVHLELDLSPRRVDLLDEGFDLAIRIAADLPDDTLLVARPLAVFPYSLYAAPSYLARSGEPREPGELAHHQGLLLQGRQGESFAWSLQSGEQRWQGLPPARAAANSPDVLMILALAGAGIAAIPDYFAAPAWKSGKLQRVLPDWLLLPHRVWAVFLGRRLMPAKTRVFIDLLAETLTRVMQECPQHSA